MANFKQPWITIFLLPSFLILLFLLLITTPSTEGKSRGLTLKLSHRFSRESLASENNGNLTCKDVHNLQVEADRKRLKYLQFVNSNHKATSKFMNHLRYNNTSNFTSEQKTTINVPMGVDPESLYYTYAAIGTGNQLEYYKLHVDTASALSWAPCYPWRTRDVNGRPLPPPNGPLLGHQGYSSTFRKATANEYLCNMGATHVYFPNPRSNICGFYVEYFDGTHVSGELAFETFSFETRDRETGYASWQHFEDVPFGCAYEATARYPENGPAGILGLNMDEESFLSAKMQGDDRRISYCLGPAGSPDMLLTIGADVPDPRPIVPTEHTHQTPFATNNRRAKNYFLNLNSIRIGQYTVPNIQPWMFQINRRSRPRVRGTMIDTGAQYSQIQTNAFQLVLAELRRQFQILGFNELNCHAYGVDSAFCFHVPVSDPAHLLLVYDALPPMTWVFGNNEELYIPSTSLYSLDCVRYIGWLLIYDGDDTTILGARQQINYRMTYDISRRYLQYTAELCG